MLDRDKKRMSRIYIIGDPPPSPEQKSPRLFHLLSRYRVHVVVFIFLVVVVSLCIFFLNQNKTETPVISSSSDTPVVPPLPVAAEKSNHTIRNTIIVIVVVVVAVFFFVKTFLRFEPGQKDFGPSSHLNSIENITKVNCVYAAVAQAKNALDGHGMLFGNDLIQKRRLMQESYGRNIPQRVEELGEKQYNKDHKWKDLNLGHSYHFIKKFTTGKIPKFATAEEEALFLEYRSLTRNSAMKLGEKQKKGGARMSETSAWAAIAFRTDPVVIDIIKLHKKGSKVVAERLRTIDPNGWLENKKRFGEIRYVTIEKANSHHVRYACIPDKLFERIPIGTEFDYSYVRPELRTDKKTSIFY